MNTILPLLSGLLSIVFAGFLILAGYPCPGLGARRGEDIRGSVGRNSHDRGSLLHASLHPSLFSQRALDRFQQGSTCE